MAAPKPVGHWTDQLNVPLDRAEPFDQLLSRGGVSHGVPTTTNALILPMLPDTGPLGNPLANSGDVIVTGSVDLPRSVGATGVHPSQIDSSDVVQAVGLAFALRLTQTMGGHRPPRNQEATP